MLILFILLSGCNNDLLSGFDNEINDHNEALENNIYSYTGTGLILENAFWRVRKFQSVCRGTCWVGDYYTAGDSTVNNLIYTKIRLKSIHKNQQEQIKDEFISLVRNDHKNNKVFRLLNDGTEQLMYDFNMKVGDTIKISSDKSIVESIDDYIFENDTLKQFNLVPIQDEEWVKKFNFSIIEGIGSTNGLFQGVSISYVNYDGSNLECFSVGNLVYKKNSTCNKFDFDYYWFD
ncbi:hypothetical protein NH26_19495 [Flammeovirga pacifica]|uniref:Uncharacterized protein n=2 Tax=Flammeovirga pacifica TaxID=915059 RepID=A0A1S1Z583_FLAPC|nr:hypothetical protein NH26_19495 [Flammeovirga pacifica]